jgi:hypothetical protein
MLCVAACVCLFLTRSVNKPHKSADEPIPDSNDIAMTKVSLPAMTVLTLEHVDYRRTMLEKPRYIQPLPDFHIGPCEDDILQRHQTAVVPIRQNPRWAVTVIRGNTVQTIRSEPALSRQQLGISTLSKTDENGDKWVLDLARGQSLSSLKDSSAKSGPPLLVKTDVKIKGRNVSIDLIVEGQAGEKYAGGVRKNRQRQPAPGFNIVDDAGKVLISGRFKYG